MRKFIFYSLTIIIFGSCLQQSSNNINNQTKRDNSDTLIKFRQFLKKFKPLALPFYASTGCYEPDSINSIKLDMDNDSLFVGNIMGVSVGIFPDTTVFNALIYCGAAECYMPILAVYSKSGRKLSEEPIVNGCGSGPGYMCSDSLVIRSMIDITQIFKEETVEIDSVGNEMERTRKKTIRISKFNLDNTGKINKTVTNNH
jgi:hypothetical protein